MPLTATLLWHLAQQSEFDNRTFSTAVDVPADARQPRAVDLVAIRPADYFDRLDGFATFVRDFLALVASARARATRSFAAMRALGSLPPWLARRTMQVHPQRTRATFGTVGLSMLKDARVFVAPMADGGWEDGFLAIGNTALPSADGRTVAAFTAKGDADQIRHYPTALRRAVAGCAGAPA